MPRTRRVGWHVMTQKSEKHRLSVRPTGGGSSSNSSRPEVTKRVKMAALLTIHSPSTSPDCLSDVNAPLTTVQINAFDTTTTPTNAPKNQTYLFKNIPSDQNSITSTQKISNLNNNQILMTLDQNSNPTTSTTAKTQLSRHLKHSTFH